MTEYKRKYPKTFHWFTSPGLQNDDRLHPNPELFINQHIVITEKLDGGNTLLHDGDVYARSTSNPSNAGWFAMAKKHHAWKTVGMENKFFYGEDIYGVHSIEYGPVPESETFYLFAIKYKDQFFDSWGWTKQTAAELEMQTVPELYQGKFDNTRQVSEWFEEEIQKPSVLGGEREGFVMRFASSISAYTYNDYICKYVRKDHVQTDEHWTKNWNPCKIR